MELQISIDEKAQNFLSKKGNMMTLSSICLESCCVPIHEVVIQYTKPEKLQMFKEIKLGNISLFIDKKLEFKDRVIKLKHSGFGPFQTIQVDGLTRF